MKTLTLNSLNMSVLKYKVKNHTKLKHHILRLIDTYPVTNHESEDSLITKTDYFERIENPLHAKLKYFSYFEQIEPDFYEFLKDRFYVDDFYTLENWFQQYQKNDKHVWHSHPNCSIAWVYFVELDSQLHSTEFYDTINKSTYQVDAGEGDIIVFPAHFPHRSPVIVNDTRKTIISSNVIFDSGIDEKRIKNELS